MPNIDKLTTKFLAIQQEASEIKSQIIKMVNELPLAERHVVFKKIQNEHKIFAVSEYRSMLGKLGLEYILNKFFGIEGPVTVEYETSNDERVEYPSNDDFYVHHEAVYKFAGFGIYQVLSIQSDWEYSSRHNWGTTINGYDLVAHGDEREDDEDERIDDDADKFTHRDIKRVYKKLKLAMDIDTFSKLVKCIVCQFTTRREGDFDCDMPLLDLDDFDQHLANINKYFNESVTRKKASKSKKGKKKL